MHTHIYHEFLYVVPRRVEHYNVELDTLHQHMNCNKENIYKTKTENYIQPVEKYLKIFLAISRFFVYAYHFSILNIQVYYFIFLYIYCKCKIIYNDEIKHET